MLVCLCKGISERKIQELVKQGVTQTKEVMQCSGAGTECGSCITELQRICESHSQRGSAHHDPKPGRTNSQS